MNHPGLARHHQSSPGERLQESGYALQVASVYIGYGGSASLLQYKFKPDSTKQELESDMVGFVNV